MSKPRGNHRRPALLKRVTIVLLATGLAGCGDSDFADLQSYVAEVKSRQKSSIEPLPEVKTVEPFVFAQENLRNPFVPDEKIEQLEENKAENGIRPDTARAREELESYDLDMLRMVGTINLNNSLWGLVKAKDGTIHRVRAGNFIGRNFGKIIRIKEDQIELLEIVPDAPGAWRERKASLELSEAGGDKK